MNTVKYSYSKQAQGTFLEKLGFIIFSLTDNDNFPTLVVALAVIIAKKEAYEEQLDKSKAGDHQATTVARKYRRELDLMLKKNGIYINFTADGDITKLLSSGYDLAKIPVRTPRPEIEILPSSQRGVAKVIIQKGEKTVAYQVETHADPIPPLPADQRWQRHPMCTRHYQSISGIPVDTNMWLRYYTVSSEEELGPRGPFKFKIL